jgi:hypothetical protein
MRTLSARALAAFFGTECAENAILLLRLSGANLATPIYICNAWTKRLTSLTTDDEVVYGLTSGGVDHIFMPVELPWPGDAEASGPRSQISIYDPTQRLLPAIRNLSGPPTVRLQLVFQGSAAAGNGEAVSAVEMEFNNLELRGLTYEAGTVTGYLVMESLENEPFPCHTMTPASTPRLF